jgi:hypothetical protein
VLLNGKINARYRYRLGCRYLVSKLHAVPHENLQPLQQVERRDRNRGTVPPTGSGPGCCRDTTVGRPDVCIGSFDSKNAFNTMRQRHMLEGIPALSRSSSHVSLILRGFVAAMARRRAIMRRCASLLAFFCAWCFNQHFFSNVHYPS